MTAMGVDVARGGQDATVLSPRFGNWFGEQKMYPGTSTPDGPAAAGLVIACMEGNPAINVDVIGVGTSVYDTLKQRSLRAVAMNGSERSTAHDKTKQLTFRNKRAEWWWKMREALDPHTGEDLALPPDRGLFADLCAPRWKLSAQGIQVESKEEIKKRIGRSPDKGDSAVYALATEYRQPISEQELRQLRYFMAR